jgi:hypothetical protein
VRKRNTIGVVVVSTLLALSLILSSQIFLTTTRAQSLPANLPHQYSPFFSSSSNGLGINTATPSPTAPRTSSSLFSFSSTQLHTPIANAGKDQVVYQGATVRLDGTRSFDPNNGGVVVKYKWIQIGGVPFVSLLNGNTAIPSFIAPSITTTTASPLQSTTQPPTTTASSVILTFSLSVTDSRGLSSVNPSIVHVVVVPLPPYYSSYPGSNINNNNVLSNNANPSATPATGSSTTASALRQQQGSLPSVYNNNINNKVPISLTKTRTPTTTTPLSSSSQLNSTSKQQQLPTSTQSHGKLITIHRFAIIDVKALRKPLVSEKGGPVITMPLLVEDPKAFQLAKERANQNLIKPTVKVVTLAPPNSKTTATLPSTITSGVAASSAPSPAISQLTGFNGLRECQFFCNDPPDQAVAVGPNHVMQLVNNEGQIYTKQGVSVSLFDAYTFFAVAHGPNGDFISDPELIFDKGSQRWFASVLDREATSRQGVLIDQSLIAVSTSNDPTGTWVIYRIPVANGHIGDQPSIGVSDNKFAISTNNFVECGTLGCMPGGGPVGTEYIILNKSDMILGSSVRGADFGENNEFSIVPVRDDSPGLTSTLYMVSNHPGNAVDLYYVTGLPGVSDVSVRIVPLAISQVNIPPDAKQPNTSSSLVNTEGSWVHTGGQPVYSNGRIWLAFNDACIPSGDSQSRSCFRLDQLNPNLGTVLQDFDVGAAGFYYFYPALGVDSSGNVDVVFGDSSSSIFASLAATGQVAGSSVQFDRPAINLASGSQSLLCTPVPPATTCSVRYGDYFAAATDPADPSLVYGGGELPGWSTFIGIIDETNLVQTGTTLTLNQIGNVPWSFFPLTLTGRLTTSAGGLGGMTITFSGTGLQGSNLTPVTTNPDGTFSSLGSFAPNTVGTWSAGAAFQGTAHYQGSAAGETFRTVAHGTTLTLNTINTVPWSTRVVVSGQLTDNGGGVVSGKTITFSGTGASSISSVTTNPDGTFTAFGFAPNSVATGWTVQAHFAGDSIYNRGDSSTQTYNTLKHATALTLSVPLNVPFGTKATVTGKLSDSAFKITGLASKTITFTAPNGSPLPASVVTRSDGTYSSTFTASSTIFSGWKLQAHFAGDSLYNAAGSPINSYNTVKHATALTLSVPLNVPWGSTAIAKGKLTDTSAGSIGVASKTITFTSPNGSPLPASVTTSSDGTFGSSFRASSTIFSGWKIQSKFAGDTLYNAAGSPIDSYNTVKHTGSLAFVSLAPNVPWSRPTSFPVILRDTSNGGTALGGQTIHFTGTGVVNVANKVTDSTGKATGIGISPNTVATGWTYQAQYAGNTLYTAASTFVHTYNTLKHSTGLSLVISPSSVPSHGTYGVSGVLTDITTPGALASKTITFTATSPITISARLTNTAGQYSATGLTAPTTPANYNIQSHFAGTPLYNPSNSPTHILAVTAAATSTKSIPTITTPNPIITAPKLPIVPIVP